MDRAPCPPPLKSGFAKTSAPKGQCPIKSITYDLVQPRTVKPLTAVISSLYVCVGRVSNILTKCWNFGSEDYLSPQNSNQGNIAVIYSKSRPP